MGAHFRAECMGCPAGFQDGVEVIRWHLLGRPVLYKTGPAKGA